MKTVPIDKRVADAEARTLQPPGTGRRGHRGLDIRRRARLWRRQDKPPMPQGMCGGLDRGSGLS